MIKRVLYPSSHWASNIGNPFFNLGAKYLIEQCLPGVEVIQTDLHAGKCFALKEKHLSNSFNYTQYFSDIDAIVLAGPLFDKNFEILFGDILRQAKESNIKVIFLTAGGIEYSAEEVAFCRAILKKYPPFILTTRDEDTYNNYNDLAHHSYNGICTAWFTPDFYPGYDTSNLTQYMTSCFDHTSEPKINLDGFSVKTKQVVTQEVKHSTFNKVKRLFQKNLPEFIGDYLVIRPVHCCIKRLYFQLFFKKNAFVSQTPYGFLNLYRNTSLTVTDRLHAAVATMAYGNPAILYIKSNRPKLLERLGVESVMNEITRVDMERLNTEKDIFKTWLSKALIK